MAAVGVVDEESGKLLDSGKRGLVVVPGREIKGMTLILIGLRDRRKK